MLLSARFLNDVSGVNNFYYASEVRFSEGDAPTIYLQLSDASVMSSIEGFNPSGRRYVPASGATLSVTIENINNAKKVTRIATQPYAQDPSIWAVTLLTTDMVHGTASITLTLTQGSVVTKGYLRNAIKVDALTGGC